MNQQLKREAEDSGPVNRVFPVICSEGHRKGSISLQNMSFDIACIANLLLNIWNDINTSIRDLAVSFFSRTGINIDSVRVRDSKLKF